MTQTGTVTSIHIAQTTGAQPEPVDSVRAVAGRGLDGDRYYHEEGTFGDRDGCAVTFIESEALAAAEREYDVSLSPGAHRRNVTTRGVALNHLVGERFRVGDAVCLGTELCEPCSYLERHLEQAGVQDALVHRGGLRARIVESGDIREKSSIEFPISCHSGPKNQDSS
ncbi:MOSC domain-containing protein [Halorientalis salina]|uniref:MOSC domain-containing protein n=1 Tax=Halorientalis salina TaxID=2932266 RepID=UPI0010AD64A0|nr:MOSC domain-containing protein [Halorientalis salina]